MPRSLVLGNGEILVCFDRHGQVRDFYYPHVGGENQTADCYHKIGVWVEGAFSWISDSGWETSIDYESETLISKIVAENKAIGIELRFTDAVYNEQNIFMRKVNIKNNMPRDREIRIFFNQQFQISGMSHGNTAYYDPDLKAIIHYRGPRVFLVSGESLGTPFDDYGIGLFNAEGKEGTWKDAEDGSLSKNPVEHGSVDSTIGFNKKIQADGEFDLHYWVIAAPSVYEVKGLNNYVHIKTVNHILRTTTDFWHAWVNKIDVDFRGIDRELVALFKKSLLIMRTHFDNQGAIIASGDSDILQHGRDTYSYMWPRDAAITAMAFDRIGYFEITRRFYEFCNDIISEEGYLHHKYKPDKSLGSTWHPWVYEGKKQLAIQEDETALVLYALWCHYANQKDLEFIERIYNSFIKKTADFLYFYRDERTGLPYGSYDLWEEKFGTSTYTAAVVYAALVAASNFAKVLGKTNDTKKYQNGASAVKEGVIKHLYNQEEEYFYKLIDTRKKDPVIDKTHDLSSFHGVFKFGILGAGDKKLVDGFKSLNEGMCCVLKEGDVGGAIRYEGDKYQARHKGISNPWIIPTLWMYQYEIASAKTKNDLKNVEEKLHWMCDRALLSGILSEQLDPFTGEQLSVAPLTWSHAEYVITILDYLDKLAELDK